jgi:TonB family protein
MSSSPAISNDKAKPEERRGSLRGILVHHVVLVFFGEDNWGKLSNMSESGMALEFSRPPSLGERVNFTFQVMGCMPMPHNPSALGESFEVVGEIVWLREFERIAGVRFVDLAEGSRDQIRQWLSLETSAATPTTKDEGYAEAAPMETELPTPPTPLTPELQTAGTEDAEASKETKQVHEILTELDAPEFFAGPGQKVPSSLAKAIPEVLPPTLANRGEVVEWQPNIKSYSRSHPSVARLTFLVVSGCLAAFIVTAGVRIFMARAARRADAPESALAPTAAAGGTASTASVSSADASAAISSPEAAAPFQVEVLDDNGKRWMLWFVRNGSTNGDDQIVPKPTGAGDKTSSVARTTKRKEAGQAQEPPSPRVFTMVAPHLNRPAGNGATAGNPSAEAPSLPTGLAVPQGEPIGGALNSRVTPPAPDSNMRIGGMVQEAQLIRSVPPTYPALAKTTRVSGDVVVDALINASGNVTTVKVVSGPVLLQQAAIETVRQWKYAPARLDGQAVAMHLTVTVKFRLN